MLDWEWYRDGKTMRLFLHLLLKANFKDNKWRGHKIKRGQLITGLRSLSEETGLSIQNIRTSLKQLTKTGEINTQSNNQFTLTK